MICWALWWCFVVFSRKTSLVQCQLGTNSSEIVLISEASRPSQKNSRDLYNFQCFKSLGFLHPLSNPTTLELTQPCRANSKGADETGNGRPKKVVSLVRKSALPPKNGAPKLFLVGSRIDISKTSCPDEYLDASQWLEPKHGFQPFLDIFVSKNTCC